jgi:hypothetical protein
MNTGTLISMFYCVFYKYLEIFKEIRCSPAPPSHPRPHLNMNALIYAKMHPLGWEKVMG